MTLVTSQPNNLVFNLEAIPPNWYWGITNSPIKGKIKVGKKWKEVPYTVYVSNGEMFMTKYYSSAFIDCEDIVTGIQQAVAEVRRKEAELREEERKRLEKEKAKKK